MTNKNNFDFERLVQLFQADTTYAGFCNRGDLIDIGDIVNYIWGELQRGRKTLEDIDVQLVRIANALEQGANNNERQPK